VPSAADQIEAVFAMPVHDAGRHLDEALETVLAQAGRRLAVVALDDASTDGSLGVLEAKARDDERVVVHASAQRLGIPRAWNLVMDLALAHAPRARYAAWAGDHDRWSPDWLTALADALDECPEAALAVPLTRKIDVAGKSLRDDERRLDTRGIGSPLERVRATVREMVAGNQIYGLFRRQALERALPLAHVLLFDRLLLAAIALEGSVVQVDGHLWERRTFAKPVATVLDRERRTFWPDGAPAWTRLPPVVQGGAVLAWRAASGRTAPDLPRWTALRAAAVYVRETRRTEREVKRRRQRRAARAAAREAESGRKSPATPVQ
jgi:glycosyltransferase involved in cell wall biosynthesis